MKKAPAKTVRGSELQALLSDPARTVDEEFSATWPWPVYGFPDGSVLFMLGKKKGSLWFRRSDVPSGTETAKKIQPMAQFRFDAEFVDKIPGLLEDACERLSFPKISDSNLTSCMKSLDLAVARIGPRKSLKKDIFPLILAYAGEIFRVWTAGHWTMNKIDDQSWQPYIVGANGVTRNLGAEIYNELYEHGRAVSIEAILTIYPSTGSR